MREKIVIIGMGGHAHSVIDSLLGNGEYEIAGYVDKNNHGSYLGISYLGDDDKLFEIHSNGITNAIVTIGFMGKSSIRNTIYNELKKIGYKLPVVIDKTAIIADNVSIDEGTFVGKGSIINANSQIGKMCIINSKALIEHDSYVGDFSHIAVSACLCGEVKVGIESFIGANSTIVQCLSIGNNVFIGAGMLVTNNITDGKRFTLNEP